MMTASLVTSAFSGMGLHPPGMPTDCGLIGAAQFLQMMPLRTFVEADRAADFAGVEQGGDLAVGLLVDPEADFDFADFGFEAVQVAVVDLIERHGHFAVHERDFGGRRERAGASFRR